MRNIYEVQSANKAKSMIVIIGFMLFVGVAIYVLLQAMSYWFGYQPGGLGMVGLAFIISGATSLGSYWYSDKIVLAISRAHPADRRHHFNFYTAAENLAMAAGLPKPRLYIIDDSAPNAFATGRDPNHAVVVATTGLLDKLNRTELEGVIAHELTHIKNYDVRLMSVVSVLVGTVALLADWFLRMSIWGGRGRDNDRSSGQLEVILLVVGFIFALLSPIISQLIQLSISRRREFVADAGAVAITRQPEGLINALQKLAADHEPLEAANKATAHMYIVSPFKGKARSAVSTFAGLFNTHPPMEERIKALRQMV